MAVSQLTLFNGALRECQQRKLSSLSEDVPPRYVLDDIWDGGRFISLVLEKGLWRFASRSVEWNYDSSVTTTFGYAHAFEKPSDHVRTAALCTDEYFNSPLDRYEYSGGYYYADVEPLYLRYVSNDASYGGDYTLWPGNFTLYVETFLATLALPRLSGSKADRLELEKLAKRRLNEAQSTDAMESPPAFPPSGSFVRARGGRGGGDRGSRSSLTG